MSILAALLALAGLANALYFTFAYYGRIKGARWLPAILCAPEGANCVTVLQTPYAHVFGLPNSLLGILYYLGALFWAGTGFGLMSPVMFARFTDALLVIALGTLVLGFYLIYALRRKLRLHCPMCYAAHFINCALMIIFLVRSRAGSAWIAGH